jgi:hypothetical protein
MAIGVALFASGQSILWLPLIGAFTRLVGRRTTATGDLPATAVFVALIAVLTQLASLR